jgi:hypothetical protein
VPNLYSPPLTSRAEKYLSKYEEGVRGYISMADAKLEAEDLKTKESLIWISILDYLMFCFKDEETTEEEKPQIQEMFNTIMGMVPEKYCHAVYGCIVKHIMKRHGEAGSQTSRGLPDVLTRACWKYCRTRV